MKENLFILCILIFSIEKISCATFGSDTAVQRFNTQQVLAAGDRVAGFAEFAAGFRVTVGASVLWDCFFPVIGEMVLNGGTLVLNQDLIFHNSSSISALGNIGGQSHVLELAPSIECIPTGVGCSCNFLGQVDVGFQVNGVSWSYDVLYLAVAHNDDAAGDDIDIYSFNGTSLTLAAGFLMQGTVLSTAWHPTRDWIMAGKSGDGATDELRNLNFDRATNVITLLSSANLGGVGDDCNFIAWHPDGDHVAIARNSAAAGGVKIQVYPVNTTTGVLGAPVSVSFTPEANGVDWNSNGTFLVAGTAVAAAFNELRVYTFVKSPISLTLNASVDTGQTINSVSWNKYPGKTNFIAVGKAGGTSTLDIYTHNSGAGTLTLNTSATLTTVVNQLMWNPTGSCVAAVLNANTEGSGNELRTFSFVNNNSLQEFAGYEFGEAALAVNWSPDGLYIATGDGVTVSPNSAKAFSTSGPLVPGGAPPIFFDSIYLYLNGDITMSSASLTFTGNSMIHGRGNTMTLDSSFTMSVGANSSLLFKDITIAGVTSQNIAALDNTGTFSFENTKFVLSGDYTFAKGTFDVLQNFVISGESKTFIYQSPNVSTVRGGKFNSSDLGSPIYLGSLILDEGVTFSYDIVSSSSLLQMESSLSKLTLNSATLAARSSLSLTKGQLFIEGKSSFSSGTSIILGDSILATNNMNLEILPAANLNVLRGSLIYRNV